ncbi:MAG: phosphoribosyl-AMP cyclohydrolase, partial [Gammaproteobacteria bacterium]|nr:phosphoribosyl-AMP cyclohydrolase [Gammaproteobacteria bacterium]
MTSWLDEVRWNDDGLVPAIAQEVSSGTVLMVAWMNRESLRLTFEEGFAVYWSRSRQKLWRKGESSGHRQKVADIRLDCDEDVILLKVEQAGGIALGRFSLAAGNNEDVEIAQCLGQPLAPFVGEHHRCVVLGPRQREATPKLAEQWLADLVTVQGVLAGQAA